MGEINHGRQEFKFDDIPDPTPEEMASAPPHSGREVGGEAHGNAGRGDQLAAMFDEEEAAEATAEAGGPQRGREEAQEGAGELASVDAEPGAHTVDAWDSATWEANVDDFDAPERLAQVPETIRPMVERLAKFSVERAARQEQTYADQLDAGLAVERTRVEGVVDALTNLRDKRLLPMLNRLENAGVVEAEQILNDFTRLVNEAGQQSEREIALQREIAVMRWRSFTASTPEADALLAAAKREQAGKAPGRATDAVKYLGEKMQALSPDEAWALTTRRFPHLAKAPVSAPPSAPPSAPYASAVALNPQSQPIPVAAPKITAPPTRMAPKAAALPTAGTKAAGRRPVVDDESLLNQGWAEFKQERGGW